MATLVAACLLGGRVRAADCCCCAQCGCQQSCQKVCRLVREEKKVEIICWGCKCEDFCLPGPGTPGCKHCTTVCADCDAPADGDAPHVEPKRFVWFDWLPGCATMHTKKKLMQKKVAKTIPSYKWVVEDLCPGCEAKCECAAVPSGEALPPLPAVDAQVKVAPAVANLPTTQR
jgi:hypothetical protein